jgi:Uma2 family endonuclease
MEHAGTGLLGRNPWVVRRPLTVVDYHRMGEAGILSDSDRVELIEGELVAMSPVGSRHAGAINKLNRLLVRAVGDRGLVSVQNSIRLDDRTEPEPDVAVLKPSADDYFEAIPGPSDVLLVIEVADSSLSYDRTVKAPLYAGHSIPEFWIVDLAGRAIEVHRKPEAGHYTEVTRVGAGVTLEPSLLPGVAVPVASVLG